jgi:hypothetical protein
MGISKVNFGGDTLIDLTNDSVDAASLLKGKTAHNAAGEQIVGEIDDVKGSFYVTVTQGNGNSATADKKPVEVYAAYEAGYAVYALVKFRNYAYPFILPLVLAADDSGGDIALGFTATGASGPTERPQYTSVLSIFGEWLAFVGTLARPEDIPTIPTALKNPNALTIKIGSTTVTYDGSTAQTVTIDDGTEVAY